MSIATMRGDAGQTGLSGGVRVSKASPRVEAHGTLDELISTMGFARSICPIAELCVEVKQIQKELFKVASAISTPPESPKGIPVIDDSMVDALTAHVHRIEAIPEMLDDWSLPGEDPGFGGIRYREDSLPPGGEAGGWFDGERAGVAAERVAVLKPALRFAVAVWAADRTGRGRECGAAR